MGWMRDNFIETFEELKDQTGVLKIVSNTIGRALESAVRSGSRWQAVNSADQEVGDDDVILMFDQIEYDGGDTFGPEGMTVRTLVEEDVDCCLRLSVSFVNDGNKATVRVWVESLEAGDWVMIPGMVGQTSGVNKDYAGQVAIHKRIKMLQSGSLRVVAVVVKGKDVVMAANTGCFWVQQV